MKRPFLRLGAGAEPPQEIELDAGATTIGRSPANTVMIDDPSISGTHCEILREGEAITVKDLGSTNGTFIDGRRIGASRLEPGQRLRLGTVELTCEAGDSAPAWGAAPPPSGDAPPIARPMNVPGPVRVAPPASRPAVGSASQPGSFFGRLPGALAYPFSLNGILVLVVGSVVYTGADFISRFSFLISAGATGYLFAYMQKIISSSAQGERELPDWPELGEWWGDILRPFFLLCWTCLCCFGPAWALYTFGDRGNPLVMGGAMALLLGGGLYFPMALLVVGTTDNFLGLHPLVVVPSILRVIGPYLVVCLILAVLLGVRIGGGVLAISVRRWVWPAVVLEFVSLYLLCVEMRILGLLYYTNRERLNWFS
jgi:hypothetical protein